MFDWAGKRCLITGADGFLAVHLAARLIGADAVVLGTVRNRARAVSRLDLFDVRRRMTVVHCDLRDFRAMLDIIGGEEIDTVFHVGASAIVGTAARSPLEAWETNVLGTCNVLDACRLSPSVRRIVVASSDKAYGDHSAELPYKEPHSLRGLRIYECSKSCTDLIAQTYHHQFRLPLRITRCCNIYGPGDLNFSRLIPGTVARLMEDKPPVIRPGQGDVRREYVYIQDAVDAYLQIAASIPPMDTMSAAVDGHDCAYNVGSGEQHIKSVREMLALIGDAMDKPTAPVERTQRGSAYGELPDQFLDCTKIRERLRWTARTTLAAGIRSTVRWYLDHRHALGPLYGPVVYSDDVQSPPAPVTDSPGAAVEEPSPPRRRKSRHRRKRPGRGGAGGASPRS
jgi:CDP-glucose 4,6-dehydratase